MTSPGEWAVAATAQAAQQTFCHIACLAHSGGAAVNIGRAGLAVKGLSEEKR